MKIIKVLVDEMPSGCKRCNFCVAKMYCSLLEDRKTTVPDEPYKRRADCPLVYDFGDRESNALNKRIAELEAENEKINYFFRRLRMFCIFAHWDNPNTEAEFYKVDEEIHEYLSEYKVCIDQLTAHDATERQDDKSPNDTQTQTIVYGKEREE